MHELRRCPFCGGEAEVFSDVTFKAETGEEVGKNKYFVWCTECPALTSGDTREEAVGRWNRRANNEDATV